MASSEHAGIFLDAVNDGDVRMGQRGKDSRLSPEAFAPGWVERELIGDDLQRDEPVEGRIAGAIHFAHPPSAQLAEDFISAELRSRPSRHPSASHH